MDVVLAVMWAGVISLLSQTSGYDANELELAFLVYAMYHAALYRLWDGQTLGLRIFDIRTVSAVGGVELSFKQAVARAGIRPLTLYLLGWAAYSIAPRQPEIVALAVAAPLLAELGMMLTLPTRQTLADVASRTLVVNVPPPQPHRAPAAPMYSPSDAEFGVRPRRRK